MAPIAKHIKIEAEEIANGYVVTIVEQTHRGSDFGVRGNEDWKAPNGLVLASAGYPAAIVEDEQLLYFYVRGSSVPTDFYRVHLSEPHFAKLRAAVEAYNKAFEGPAPPAVPRPTTKIVTVG
jgi:hypothetical protein